MYLPSDAASVTALEITTQGSGPDSSLQMTFMGETIENLFNAEYSNLSGSELVLLAAHIAYELLQVLSY